MIKRNKRALDVVSSAVIDCAEVKTSRNIEYQESETTRKLSEDIKSDMVYEYIKQKPTSPVADLIILLILFIFD